MKVIDASALSKYVLKEPGWKEVAQHLREGVSPTLVAKEAANSIWKAWLKGVISIDDAKTKYKALKLVVGKVITTVDQAEIIDEAFEIALKTSITVYDALYIALAREKALPLVTCDGKQASEAEKAGVEVIEY